MRTPKIAVVGSLNMDLVVSMKRMPHIGETIHGDSIHYIPGGKGANQAVGCARLGAEAVMIGAVGDDAFGRSMTDNLGRYGISAAAVAVLPGVPSGTASIFHTPEDNCIVIVPGANGEMTPALVERYRRDIQSADVLLVQLEVPLPAVERALAIAREAGVCTVLNPAPASPLPAELLRLCDIVTPNESEFELLGGVLAPAVTQTQAGRDEAAEVAEGTGAAGTTETVGATETAGTTGAAEAGEPLADAMAAMQAAYGNRLVVTRGKHGVSYLDEGQLVTVAAPKVDVVDTTGAGDCFNAALSFGLASGWEWSRSVSFAVRAASQSVTKFGAQSGMPTFAEVGD